MPTLASYFYHGNNQACNGHPIVHLHGSGRSEADGADFMARLASGRMGIFVRAPHPFKRGYTFIRRNDDRSLDQDDIAEDARSFAQFLEQFPATHPSPMPKPVLAGYSSGAIMAAATLWNRPELIAGAILLRPQSPYELAPVPLSGLPILIISGIRDERRAPHDASLLEDQLRIASARVTHLTVNAGHAEAADGSDLLFVRNWLQDTFPAQRQE
jgi:phospholipase/carboxylesterase